MVEEILNDEGFNCPEWHARSCIGTYMVCPTRLPSIRSRCQDLAIRAFRYAIQLEPNFPDAYNNLGNALRESGQLEVGTDIFLTASLAPNCKKKGNDRITQCEHGKAPTRHLHSNTRCCLWTGHTIKQSITHWRCHP